MKSDLLHQLVDLVPHLGRREVVGGGLGVLAGGPLDARELVDLARGVHDEAHAAGQLRLLEGAGSVGRPAVDTGTTEEATVGEAKEAEAEEEDFETDEDGQVGQVEGEHLRGGAGPGHEVQGCPDEGRLIFFCVGVRDGGGHDGCASEVLHLVRFNLNLQ